MAIQKRNNDKSQDKPKKQNLNPTKSAEDYPAKQPRNYDLYKTIRTERDYKSNIGRRDSNSRKFIEENYDTGNEKSILPGQLIMFDYFEPVTKEDLEYYDAKPCTIFFGVFNTKNGKRVIGFNIHYYPPRIRFRIMQRVFEIFKPLYAKAWNQPLKTGMSHMDYKMLMEQLESAKLQFGVRMYIPKLINKIIPIPVQAWPKAVFTEGRFKKVTREAIMNYWKKLKQK